MKLPSKLYIFFMLKLPFLVYRATFGSNHYLLRARLYTPTWENNKEFTIQKCIDKDFVNYRKYNLDGIFNECIKHFYQ